MGPGLALAAAALLAAQQDVARQYLDTFERAWTQANLLRNDDEKDTARALAITSLTGGPTDPRIRAKVVELLERHTIPRDPGGPQMLRVLAAALARYPADEEAADAAILTARNLLDDSLMRRMNIRLYEPAVVAALASLGEMHRSVTRPRAPRLFPLLDLNVIREHPPGITLAAVEALQKIAVKESIPPLLNLMKKLQEDFCRVIQRGSPGG